MAWSTPGAALLVTALAGVPFNEAVGAFVLAAALTLACGLFGWIDPILRRIPGEIAAAMLAGVLLNFGMGVFTSLGKQPALVLAMCAAYLLCRRWARYAVLVVMGVAVAVAAAQGLIQTDQLNLHLTEFVWTTPVFSAQAAISLGIPLFVVAMASQNLPGLAILQASGYRPPASRLVAATGVLGLLAAPFGAHSVTLGAISAAICTGPEAHPDPSKRYIAAATYGLSYFALSIVAGAVPCSSRRCRRLAGRAGGPGAAGHHHGRHGYRHGQSGAARGRADHCWQPPRASVSGESVRPSGAWWGLLAHPV